MNVQVVLGYNMSKTVSLANNTIVFFALIRAGLWEEEVSLLDYEEIDYQELYNLVDEQAVFGLVAAGLEHVVDVKVPKEIVLQFVGRTLQIEEQNKAMNSFIGVLVEKMRKADIYTLMVKGQGVAQCYERPLWRSSGDVDFYLSEDNFKKAKSFFRPLVRSFDPDTESAKHINMHYNPWVVEIHVNQNCSLSGRINRVMDDVHKDLFYAGNVRSARIGGTTVFLPSADNDVLIIFTHFLNHFYKGGLGIRQICDWCRFLWTYKDSIKRDLLQKRLKEAGLMTIWKAFAALAVDCLGMPAEAMPFYEEKKRWQRKAEKIKKFIIEVGNFGHNREAAYNEKQPRLVRKALSFSRRLGDLLHHASIFPWDSFRFLFGITNSGIKAVMHGE